MAFRKLENYQPGMRQVDNRPDDRWVIRSEHIVLTVSPFPTYKETISRFANSGGLLNTKMLGLITGHNMAESINLQTFYEIGNTRPLMVAGKGSGSMNLTSEMFESVNLLGGIYETVLQGLKVKYPGSFSDEVIQNLLYRPTLNKTYYADPNSDPTLNLGKAQAALDTTAEGPVQSDQGSLLLSILDNRLRLKFGLSFIMFQSEERYVRDFMGVTVPNATNVNDQRAAIDIGDAIGKTVTVEPKQYRIIGGLFYENCIISSYNRTANTSPIGSNLMESVNIIYTGTSRIQRDLTLQEKLDISGVLSENSKVSTSTPSTGG